MNPRSGSAVGIGVLYKTAEEVDRAYERYKSEGVPFVATPKQQDWGEYTAFFTDPDGNVHELAAPVSE
jgi:lactoylglutathione lyase